MRIFIGLFVAIVFSSAQAESYRDIGPLDNLGDIKNKFPNATVEKLSPGWAQNTDALYKLTGFGMSGSIVIKFDDPRPTWRNEAEKNSIAGRAETAEFFQNLSNQSDEEAISVNWVRWIPDTIIPIQRLISKYGKPEKSGFSDENYQPYRSWDKKGVEAFLSDDEKGVERIDFLFTLEEYRNAYLTKFNFVPDWLKEKPSQIRKGK